MELVLLTIGTICAAIFLYTFLTLGPHSKQPTPVLAHIDRRR
jgi:hypothetical protein